MPIPKDVQAQTNFSAGELDIDTKRSDNPLVKAGGRQMSNFRILNSGALKNRPGRSIVQFISPGPARVEEFIMLGVLYRIAFYPSAVQIFNSAGVSQFYANPQPWTSSNLNLISWVQIGTQIYIAFLGVQPLILNFDGTIWTSGAFNFTVTSGGQVRAPFYRLSPKNLSMLPSATTGNITLTFSTGMNLQANQTGTRMRFCGRELIITKVNSATSANATVLESLPPGEILKVSADPRTIFNLGDVVEGVTSGASGLVTALTATTVTVQLLQNRTSPAAVTSGGGVSSGNPAAGTASAVTVLAPGFVANEFIAGPGGSDQITNVGSDVTVTTPQAVTVWDDEVMNSFRGWPFSVSSDQGRLIFSNVPALPRAIIWSAINSPTDCYVTGTPDGSIFELAPAEANTVLFVLPGPESSEFVFCSNRVYYIPILPTNPLKPGSVAFQIVSNDGCYNAVQPRAVQEVILYIAAGGKSVMSIVAPGAYYRPYETRNLSELHSHLIQTPIAIAVPTATSTFEERYFYVLNANGSLSVGKYAVASGQIKGVVGLLPWSGAGTVNSVAALNADVLFSTTYPGAAFAVIELLDDTQVMDSSILVNNLPANIIAPPGKGPLWWIAGGSVNLFDGARPLGTYKVDVNGNLIPQFIGGENLTSLTLVAGQTWTATFEPFVPPAQPGQDRSQRLRKRRISRAEIYVSSSTGFRLDTLYTEQQGANLNPPGTITKTRRVPTYNQGDDPTLPPRLFERAYAFKPTGRAHDPRIAVVKDTSGPLVIEEVSLQVTV